MGFKCLAWEYAATACGPPVCQPVKVLLSTNISSAMIKCSFHKCDIVISFHYQITFFGPLRNLGDLFIAVGFFNVLPFKYVMITFSFVFIIFCSISVKRL